MILMDLMDDLIFGPLNLIDRARWLFGVIRHGNFGHRFRIVRLDKLDRNAKSSGMTLTSVNQLLKKYHIHTFGYTHDSKYLYFSVSTKQASWAEYILLRAGIGDQLDNPTQNCEKNERWASGHSGPPPAWADQSRARTDRQANGIGSAIDRLFS